MTMTNPATDGPIEWWCSHDYGRRSEQWEPHRIEVEARSSLRQAVTDLFAIAGGDYDRKNIVIPLYEPDGSLRTEWERLHVAVQREVSHD